MALQNMPHGSAGYVLLGPDNLSNLRARKLRAGLMQMQNKLGRFHADRAFFRTACQRMAVRRSGRFHAGAPVHKGLVAEFEFFGGSFPTVLLVVLPNNFFLVQRSDFVFFHIDIIAYFSKNIKCF